MSRTPPSAALSRRFDVAAAREGGTPVRFEATGDECDALAREWGLPGVEALGADLVVRREGDGVRVAGTANARVRQVCVVSLDEFTAAVAEPVDVLFAPEAEVDRLAAERASRPAGHDDEGADDLPDPYRDGRIDLGALVAEMVALGLDPYPRRPGAAFKSAAPAADAADSPFAVLRRLGEDG